MHPLAGACHIGGMKHLLLITAIALMSGVQAVQAINLPSFEAQYIVRKGGINVGAATLTYAPIEPNHYRYSLYTRARGIARLFVNTQVRELSEGRIAADGFKPEYYRYDRKGDSRAGISELFFDRDAMTVTNDVADWPWEMAITDNTIDRVTGPLQVMYDLHHHPAATQFVYKIADGGRLKTWEVTVEETETLQTPMGRFETIRVRRKDTTSGRETYLWAAPALSYLAVQAEQWDAGTRRFRLVLNQLTGLTAAEE